MKLFLLMISLLLMYRTIAIAQADVVVIVKNIRIVKGSVRVGLFDNDKDFPRKAVVGKVIAVTADSAEIVLTGLPPATYAISVFHDENDNGELDTGFFGIPKEGFAFGNNAMGRFGPPSFRNAQVEVGERPVKQVLVLKHF